MYYKCENCVNRHNCPENKAQYKNLCKAIDKAIDKLTKKKKYYNDNYLVAKEIIKNDTK